MRVRLANMYFPYLFGKAAELLALRGLSGTFGSPQRIWPIVEPVKYTTSTLVLTLKELAKNSYGIYLVVNPSKDQFKPPVSAEQRKWHAALTPYIADPAIVRPTFLQTAATPLAELTAFIAANRARPIGVVLTTGDIAPPDVASALSGTSHVVFLHRDVARIPYETALGTPNTVDIEDNFTVQARNADYLGTDHQGVNHISWTADGKAGFSDYTVLPGTYKDGGGPMGALALHLTYEKTDKLRVQHFVSATTTQGGSLAPKFDEALKDLLTQLMTTPTRFRLSPGLAKYLSQQATGVYTSPEGNKRQQIAHHIFTVGKYLGL